ncbi:hypothetical protein WG906_15525 [Pedobacter sp. P351]|uniref:hypothetical protein n=1 Tax=Pedobacter superstes TaxID=3133441 RepID=UPI0030A5FF28
MKTQFNLCNAAVIVFLLCALNVSGQVGNIDTSSKIIDTLSAGNIDTLPTVLITSSSSVNQKVSQAFNKDFQNALSPKWFEINKRYLVKFISEDQRNTALYNKRGYLIYHISYGTEKNLPVIVKNQILAQYPNANINTAIHVIQNNRKIWVVSLEQDKYYVLARIEEDQLDEVDRFKNASM